MAFPWENLITAAAAVIAGLGGAAVGGYFAARRDERNAQRITAANRDERQRDSYVTLVAIARAALRNFRALRIAFAAGSPDTPEVRQSFGETNGLAADVSHAAVVAELTGSAAAGVHARTIYQKAKACADFYQERSIMLAGLDKALGTKGVPRRFDAEKAEQLCDDLARAIDAFAGAAQEEITRQG